MPTTITANGTIAVHIGNVEQEIRYIANRIIAETRTRDRHPTFAVGKTEIRTDAARLDGMVALYGYLTGQIPSVTAPSVDVEFTGPMTTDRVERARDAVQGL